MEGILFPHAVPEAREGLEEYRVRGGYQALTNAVESHPEEIIKIISDAGLGIFFTRPISAVLTVLALAAIAVPIIKVLRSQLGGRRIRGQSPNS